MRKKISINDLRKNYLPIILILCLVKLTIHWFGNQNYGFHRDELLHLSVSEHLDWGFMEFPPLIGVIGKISYWLFDYSLLGALVMFPANEEFTITIGTRILVICSLLSMIFAIFSMLPHRYIGKEFRASNYKGTLYAENFANQSLAEFKEELNRIMESGQNTYDEMVVDLYFLGKTIAKKQKLLLISSAILLVGIISSIIYALLTGAVTFS